MRSFLWGKIEAIRREPEHVRMRYVFLCLAVSMVFIIGVWILSLSESLHSVTKNTSGAIETVRTSVPKDSVPSLNDLFNQAETLQVDKKETTGEEFFQSQVESKNTGSEGVMEPPKGTPSGN